MAIDQGAEVSVGGCWVTAIHAFHRQAVAGKGVVWFRGDELLKHLAAGFLLLGHASILHTWPSDVCPDPGMNWQSPVRSNAAWRNPGSRASDFREARSRLSGLFEVAFFAVTEGQSNP